MADKHDIDGESRNVEFVDWEDASADLAADPLRIGVHAPDAHSLWLRIGNRLERVTVATTENGTWVWHAGRARFLEKTDGDPRRKRRRTGLPGTVTPPMPATVVRILVHVGDHVERGQGLVVLSAMKMETTLSAPHDGVVQTVRTEVGATVRPGEVLVDVQALEAASDEAVSSS